MAYALDGLSRSAEAVEYWRSYLHHDRDSEWAEYAQGRLAVDCWSGLTAP